MSMARILTIVGLINVLASGVGPSMVSATTTAVTTPTGPVTAETRISPDDVGLAYPYTHQWDPIIAVDPGNPLTMVVVYDTYRPELVGPCGTGEVAAEFRRTRDGGLTWHDTAAHFWHTRGVCTSIHPSLAWGPGPEPGRDRLYFADTGYPCRVAGLCILVSYSDDAGDTWSTPYLERPPSPLRGSVPDITVDLGPRSPNYGTVHVVYNWQPLDGSRLWAAKGGQAYDGLRLLASRDFGGTWTGVEIDRAPTSLPRFAGYLISPGARVRAGPDGSVYVAFAQLNISATFDDRWMSGAGSHWVYAIQRLQLAPDGGFTKSPTVSAIDLKTSTVWPGFVGIPGQSWYLDVANGLDVDPISGLVYLAIDDYDRSAGRGILRGHVRVGRSSDLGRTWAWTTLPDLPQVGGRNQSSVKATISVSPNGARIFVGFHGLPDVPFGTGPASHLVTIGNYFSVSADGGRTFYPPIAISGSRWNTQTVAAARNGVGLRDRSEFAANDEVVFVYGDGRNAGFAGTPTYGNSDIFGAVIALGQP